MLDTLKKLFGIAPTPDLGALIRSGAIIIDVRTKAEFDGGHLKGSVNIPLQQLPRNMKDLDKEKPIITCCASGMRSGSAKGLLKSNGFKVVHNAGSWTNLRKHINR